MVYCISIILLPLPRCYKKHYYNIIFMQIKNTLIILFVLSSLLTVGQDEDKSEARSIPFIYPTYALHIPEGDFGDRFGISSDIGAGFAYKTVSNWEFGIEGNYLFSDKVNDDPLINISRADGQITNRYGEAAVVYLRLSGFHAKATIGKIIPVTQKNRNSGVYLRGSVGMLQHKIFIANDGNNVPQILDDYTQGYDRLCNGVAFSEFVGWKHYSKKSFVHVFGGVEFTQAFTENRRIWDFETNQKIEGQRTDLLYSFRVGVMILLKSRPATDYYYF